MFDQLLARARDGDQDAENELFRQLLVRFRLFAQRRVWEAGEELAQEACMVVLQKYKSETFTVGFEAWAYGVLRNIIGSYLRGRKRRRELLESGFADLLGPEECSEEQYNNLRLALLDCLEKLHRRHPAYARILEFGYQGLKTEEICRRLKMTANSAYVTLNRARAKLRLCLSGGGV